MASLVNRLKNKLSAQWQVLNKRLRKFKKPVKEATLVKQLTDAGIKPGDTLIVHSALSKIGNVEQGPKTVINALLQAVSPSGNIVMPAYSYINSMMNTTKEKSYVFDSAHTPSVVGAITEVFRNYPNVKRSIHPTHSFCAAGPDAGAIVNGHFAAATNFGEETPFHKAMQLNGKVVGLGISIGPVTIYHGFEDLYPAQFKEVYLKEPFTLNVMAEDKIVSKAIYIHNPEFHIKRIDKDKNIEAWMRAHLLKKNILHEGKFGDSRVWWMDINELFNELLVLKKQGISIYNVPAN